MPKITNDGYTDIIRFNGKRLDDLVQCRVHRAIMPPVDIRTEDIPTRDGLQFVSRRFQPLIIPVEVWLREEDRHKAAEIRHELACRLYTTEPAPLYLPDDPDIYHLAIVSEESDLGAITSKKPYGTINFYCPDPIGYGAYHSETLYGATTLEVGGNYPTWPIIYGASGSNFTVHNNNNDKELMVEGTVSSCTIDMEAQRVYTSDGEQGITILSDYFQIGPDDTSLTVTSSCTIGWYERWL